MLNRIDFVAPRPFACHRPGEIVTARIGHPLENPASAKLGKARPAVLLRRDGSRWLVMGLTTRSNFADGRPRLAVPNSIACGLGVRESFLWGRPTWVCALDIGDHIGKADDSLLALISHALH